jgi:hypothetical protein
MGRRTETWNHDLSKKLQSKSYRREFFLILIEEEKLSVREAIYTFARSMGNQEFAKLIGMSPSNASRSANPQNDVKWTTIEQILAKIGVNISAKAA